MARFNEILVGRYNRLAQKLLSMKGPSSLVTLSDELFAVVPMFHGVENRYLESWERFGSAGSQGAVAASFSTAQIRNPPSSNVMVVLEKVNFSSATAAVSPNVSIGALTTDLPTQTLLAGAFDPRGRTSSTAVVSRAAQGAVTLLSTAVWGVTAMPANWNVELILYPNQEITILPGFGLRVIDQTANDNFNFVFWWRERFLEESERT